MLFLYTGLFVSNMKILELMKELQHVKDSDCSEVATPVKEGEEMVDPCRARIGISGKWCVLLLGKSVLLWFACSFVTSTV